MAYREQAVGDGLARWVECIWSMETAEPVTGYPVRPDGCIDIVYSPHFGLQVVGTMTVERRFDFDAPALTVGVRFQPGMAGEFLRVPAVELTDRMLPLEDVCAKPGLAERMAGAGSAAECRGILIGALRPPTERLNAVQQAIETMTQSNGDIRLEWVARQAGMSERQFRRRCLEASGLAPKQLCHVLRFRRACTLAGRGLPWGLVAAEAGYFDQAHLIRDFHEFTSNTPVSVFSNTGVDATG